MNHPINELQKSLVATLPPPETETAPASPYDAGVRALGEAFLALAINDDFSKVYAGKNGVDFPYTAKELRTLNRVIRGVGLNRTKQLKSLTETGRQQLTETVALMLEMFTLQLPINETGTKFQFRSRNPFFGTQRMILQATLKGIQKTLEKPEPEDQVE